MSPISQVRALPKLTALFFFLLHATVLFADSVNTSERCVTKVAEGVYVIRHPDAPNSFPQGNTTVIIGEREALVMDSCYLPSAAREDIAQIRQWTNKPVRYLINTHWHHDHVLGNNVYWEAFPSLAIIAHTETERQIAGYIPAWALRFWYSNPHAYRRNSEPLLLPGFLYCTTILPSNFL